MPDRTNNRSRRTTCAGRKEGEGETAAAPLESVIKLACISNGLFN